MKNLHLITTVGEVMCYTVPSFSVDVVDYIYQAVLEHHLYCKIYAKPIRRVFDMRGTGALDSYTLDKIRQVASKTPSKFHASAIILDQHPNSRVTLIALKSIIYSYRESNLQVFEDMESAVAWLNNFPS